MLPRLEAEQSLEQVTLELAAEGHGLEEHARARYMNALQRRAAGDTKVPKATLETLGTMGVPVVLEDTGRKKAAEEVKPDE